MVEPVSEAQTSFVINSLDGYMQTNRRSVFVGESTQVRIVSADGLLLLPATDSFSVEPAGRIEISRSTELDGRYQLTGVTEGRATVWRTNLSTGLRSRLDLEVGAQCEIISSISDPTRPWPGFSERATCFREREHLNREFIEVMSYDPDGRLRPETPPITPDDGYQIFVSRLYFSPDGMNSPYYGIRDWAQFLYFSGAGPESPAYAQVAHWDQQSGVYTRRTWKESERMSVIELEGQAPVWTGFLGARYVLECTFTSSGTTSREIVNTMFPGNASVACPTRNEIINSASPPPSQWKFPTEIGWPPLQ